MSAARRRLAPSTPAIAAGLTLGALLVAAAVRISCARAAQGWLAYRFEPLPADIDTAIGIFATNLRLVIAVVAAVALAQTPWVLGSGTRGPIAIVLLTAADTLLSLYVAWNTFAVGAAVGAYGGRMLVAMLPHGPLEIVAFARALTLYVWARREPLAPHAIARQISACIALLGIAAALETFGAA